MAAKFTVDNHKIKADQRISSAVLYIDGELVCKENGFKKIHFKTVELTGALPDTPSKSIKVVIKNGLLAAKVTLYVDGVETAIRHLI